MPAPSRRFEDALLGVKPSLMRAPFGVRWFGYRGMQQKLGLLGVMWTVIGQELETVALTRLCRRAAAWRFQRRYRLPPRRPRLHGPARHPALPWKR